MAALQISFHFSALRSICDDSFSKKTCLGFKLLPPRNCYSLSRRKLSLLHGNGRKLRAFAVGWSFLGDTEEKDGIFMGRENKEKRVVVVRVNQGFGFNGGGGGKDNSNTARLLGNIAFAIGLTYLSMTGQLGWILDTIVSIWLLAVILPVAGLGAFLWFAGRDIVQSSCPNCGNDFQIFKSSLKDGVQLCPFCTQPFSVQDNKFVRESANFSNQSSTFRQAFNGFSPSPEKGKSSSSTVVDIEAEVKDVD